jgi:hypothetical protein
VRLLQDKALRNDRTGVSLYSKWSLYSNVSPISSFEDRSSGSHLGMTCCEIALV